VAPPKPKAFWPITIVAGVNDKLDFLRGATPFTATVAPGTYAAVRYYSGIATTPLNAAIEAAMNAVMPVADAGVGVEPGGVYRVGDYAGRVGFWTGANAATSIHRVLGFDDADVSAAPNVYVWGAHQHQNGWYADDPVAGDTGDVPEFTRSQTFALFGNSRGFDWATRDVRTVQLEYLNAYKTWVDSESVHINEAIERLFTSGWARFRWWPDATVENVWKDYVLDLDSAKGMAYDRLSRSAAFYSQTLKMRPYL
jgi:hypothetical protein